MIRRRFALLAALLALAFPTSAAHAWPETPDAARRLPALTVPGAPRSLVFVAVPIPAELAAEGAIRFVVRTASGIEVLGRLSGDVQRDSLGVPRPLLLSVRVPSDAIVGLADVAEVEFTHANGTVLIVPVTVRVLAVYGLELAGPPALNGLDRGDRIALAYRLRNLGNVPETYDVEIVAPTGWALSGASRQPVSLGAYGDGEVPVGLRVPPFLGAGSFWVELKVRRAGQDSVLVTKRTMFRVNEPTERLGGLVAEPFVALTSTTNGVGLGSGVTVRGPVRDGVELRASVTPIVPDGAPETFALASVGAMRLPFTASLVAQSWTLNFGQALSGASPLTGVNASGFGLSGTLRRNEVDYAAVVAMPTVGGFGSGHVASGEAAFAAAFGDVRASASLLADTRTAGFGSRRLAAVGADWVSKPLPRGAISAGVAVREFGEGLRLGFRGGYVLRSERDQVEVRYTHAPGGSQAFAQAINEIQVDLRRDVSDALSLDLVVSNHDDANDIFRNVEARNATLGARYRVGRRTTLGSRLSYQSLAAYTSTMGFAGFGTDSRGLAVSVQSGAGEWRFGGEGSLNTLVRSTDLFSGATDRVAASQANASGFVSRSFEQLGSVSVGSSLSRTGAGVGLPGTTITGYARWASLPLLVKRQVWRLESEGNVFDTEFSSARIGARFGAATLLRSGLEFRASLERNAFVLDRAGRPGWMAAVKVTVPTEVRTPERMSAIGTVYRDENGNGRRDTGEPGVAGVTVRFDNEPMTTNRDGDYRMPMGLRGRLRIDPATIPNGLVAHPRLSVDSTERRDIPLVPTGAMTVVLRLEADSSGRLPSVNIDDADAWIRDAEGFEWVGRNLGGGRFVFEHVPVGQYEVRLNLDRLNEPLRPAEVQLSITAGGRGETIVPVRGRTVRVITPPRAGGRGGVAPRGGARLTPETSR